MRVYFRCYDIDKTDYDTNDYQIKPTQDTDNIIYGYANKERSQMTFRNINLYSILGFTQFENNEILNIKVIDIKAINENGQNIIDVDSPPQLRTSNVVLSGLKFTNGKKENVIGQLTNYDPNEEILFENVYYHRGDLNDFQHYYDIRFVGTSEWIRYAYDNNEFTNVADSLLKYRIISPNTIPLLDNKIMRCIMVKTSDTLYLTSVLDASTTSSNILPARIPIDFVNRFVSIQILPENNQWFNKRFSDDIQEDNSNLELTAYMPLQSSIELTFQLRDILTNQLQPVITETNDKIYPSIEIILEIN
jgi:hypothetical protein